MFKKIITDAITHNFQKVGGVTQPLIYFIKDEIFSNGIALTTSKEVDFYSQFILSILLATVFNKNKSKH